MNRADERQVKRAIAVGRAGKLDEALRILDDLIGKTTDHSIKFGLLYYQMGWLLETKAVSRAREKFNEMQMQMALAEDGVQSKGRPVASTSTPPEDTDQNDLAAYLAVIARFAEAKLLMTEQNETLALNVLEDLMDRYPKQLSLRKFRELRAETEMHRGMLLGNA